MIPVTASLLEIGWTLLALPGFALSIYNANGATSDLHRHWRDGLRSVAWIGLVKVVIVLVMCVLVILAGTMAMQAPEPLRPELQEAGGFIAGCLIIIDALTLALAVAFFLERRFVVPHVHFVDEHSG